MNIHATAIVSANAVIGDNVEIGPFTIIHDDVRIGDNTTIGSHCEIGLPTALAKNPTLTIGANSTIRSHSILYAGSTFGERLTTGHRVTIREGTQAGINFQLGTLSDIQGDCVIGDYVRTHSNVHIGKHSVVGNFVWIFPYVVLTNDPHPPSDVSVGCTIGDYAAIATMSVILPGVLVGEHSLVAAGSVVGKTVEPHTVVGGAPAKFLCATTVIKLKDGTERPAYPWPTHFHRSYPEAIVAKWRDEFPTNGVVGPTGL
ncbi:N-acetyltransferase [Massilia sp. DWR3-1-1]|uniref:N-acetyltransferase n=1 Tax=Massilia sp. DWR3-1-1 TaxID=2804559 RepID=UPI003CF04969